MPNYRLTLLENLPANAPSALQVRYTYNNGNPPNTWAVNAVGPDTDTAVVVVNTAANLVNVPNVETRRLIAHYPTPPHNREFVISSLQSPMLAGAVEDLGGTSYEVKIAMDQNTVTLLNQGNFFLYGFKAVRTTQAGAPLVWFQTKQYGLSTDLQWQEDYQAYTSTSQIVPQGQIKATNSYPIGLDNTLNVTNATGTGSVDTTQGTVGAITIHNQTTTQFACGISQTEPGGTVTPMCAFPLYGGNLDVIAPIEQVLLMFSSTPVNTGTVIEQAYSPGIIIDLTAENTRQVNYDINMGWTWDGGTWAASVQASQSLVPLLIQSSPSLARRQLAARARG